MEYLSEEGAARYTEELLNIDSTYTSWTMRHDTQEIYPPLNCNSPAVVILKQFGRLCTAAGIVPLRDALGEQPKNVNALRALLEHPMAERIKMAFELAEPEPEIFGEPEIVGEEEPEPLTDLWPGLARHLPTGRRDARLVRCENILSGGHAWVCWDRRPDVYVTRRVTDPEALHLVATKLGLGLDESQLALILDRQTPARSR